MDQFGIGEGKVGKRVALSSINPIDMRIKRDHPHAEKKFTLQATLCLIVIEWAWELSSGMYL
jgi:hypothetical protein